MIMRLAADYTYFAHSADDIPLCCDLRIVNDAATRRTIDTCRNAAADVGLRRLCASLEQHVCE